MNKMERMMGASLLGLAAMMGFPGAGWAAGPGDVSADIQAGGAVAIAGGASIWLIDGTNNGMGVPAAVTLTGGGAANALTIGTVTSTDGHLASYTTAFGTGTTQTLVLSGATGVANLKLTVTGDITGNSGTTNATSTPAYDLNVLVNAVNLSIVNSNTTTLNVKGNINLGSGSILLTDGGSNRAILLMDGTTPQTLTGTVIGYSNGLYADGLGTMVIGNTANAPAVTAVTIQGNVGSSTFGLGAMTIAPGSTLTFNPGTTNGTTGVAFDVRGAVDGGSGAMGGTLTLSGGDATASAAGSTITGVLITGNTNLTALNITGGAAMAGLAGGNMTTATFSGTTTATTITLTGGAGAPGSTTAAGTSGAGGSIGTGGLTFTGLVTGNVSLNGGQGGSGGSFAGAIGGAGGSIMVTNLTSGIVGNLTVTGGAGGDGGSGDAAAIGGGGGAVTLTASGPITGTVALTSGAGGAAGTMGAGGAGGTVTANLQGSIGGTTTLTAATNPVILNLNGGTATSAQNVGLIDVTAATGQVNIAVGGPNVVFSGDVGHTTPATQFTVASSGMATLGTTGGATTLKAKTISINSGGALKVSNGTLNVSGTTLDLSATSGGTTQLIVGSAINTTLINATAVTNVKNTGTVNVVPYAGMLTTGSLRLVDASGGSTNTWGTWTTPNTFLATYNVTTDATGVTLAFNSLRSSADITSQLGIRNAGDAVLTALNGGLSNANQTSFIAAMGGSLSDARNALNKLRPDTTSTAAAVTVASSAIGTIMNEHQNTQLAAFGRYGLQKFADDETLSPTGVSSGGYALDRSTWIKGFASHAGQKMRDNVEGYASGLKGVTIGWDGTVDRSKLVGLSLSYVNEDVNGDGAAQSKTQSEVYQGTAYGTLMMKNVYINGSLGYAHGTNNTQRTTLGGAATGTFDSDVLSGTIGAGLPLDMGTYALIPQTNLAYSHIHANSYTESGDSKLAIGASSMETAHWTAGVVASTKSRGATYTWTPGVRLMADWDITQKAAENSASWVSNGATFQTMGPKPTAFGGIVGLSLGYASRDGIYDLAMDYDANVRPDFISHTGEIKWRMHF